MRLNIVPNNRPNAVGRWIRVPDRPVRSNRSWAEIERAYFDDVPEGYHIVGTERDND